MSLEIFNETSEQRDTVLRRKNYGVKDGRKRKFDTEDARQAEEEAGVAGEAAAAVSQDVAGLDGKVTSCWHAAGNFHYISTTEAPIQGLV